MARITKETDAPEASQPVEPTGKTVLMAEDDPFISRMYEAKLIHAGYKVQVVANGEAAYQEIKRVKPDLLLIDINMPDLSGLEMLSNLRSEGYDFKSSPAIVLTNSSNQADRKAAEKLGADYLIKAELTPKDVLDRINTKLGIK